MNLKRIVTVGAVSLVVVNTYLYCPKNTVKTEKQIQSNIRIYGGRAQTPMDVYSTLGESPEMQHQTKVQSPFLGEMEEAIYGTYPTDERIHDCNKPLLERIYQEENENGVQ